MNGLVFSVIRTCEGDGSKDIGREGCLWGWIVDRLAFTEKKFVMELKREMEITDTLSVLCEERLKFLSCGMSRVFFPSG